MRDRGRGVEVEEVVAQGSPKARLEPHQKLDKRRGFPRPDVALERGCGAHGAVGAVAAQFERELPHDLEDPLLGRGGGGFGISFAL